MPHFSDIYVIVLFVISIIVVVCFLVLLWWTSNMESLDPEEVENWILI
uniref:Putative ATP synthase subunit 8 n=1 Tax=Syndesmis kurakaikina TaxID=2711315 RepID=A0A7G5XUK7_9PLAT|nr:putative ATP synthase subunit 8 [Syndesmis kurakaikina]